MADRKRPRTIAREIARKLDVEDGDFILLRKGSDLTQDLRVFEALRSAFGATGRERCVIAIVDDFDDITVFKEAEMKQYGWCKCDDETNDT